MEKTYNKLIRDRIPEIIKRNGAEPFYRELSSEEFWGCLILKDTEELEELKNAITLEDRKNELADKLELIRAMAEYSGFTLEEIIDTANKKNETNGGFKKRLYLEKVIE